VASGLIGGVLYALEGARGYVEDKRGATMSKQVYILNYLRQPDASAISLDGESLDPEGMEIWNPARLSHLGIALVPISLVWKWDFTIAHVGKGISRVPMSRSPSKLFGIKINGGKQNDEFAQRFADSTMATLVLLNPSYAPRFPVAFGVPVDKLDKHGEITFAQLVEEDAQKDYKDRYGERGLLHVFGTEYHLLADEIAWIWETVPALLIDSGIFDAAHFYQASVREFVFLGDSVREVINNIDSAPTSRYDLTRAENAIQNAFKAIEALIGDPPKDDRRLRSKIKAAGLDPDEQVGRDIPECGLASQSILNQVRKLSRIRDTRAAHARTEANRRITYFEMMDAQELALMFILASAEKHLPELNNSAETTSNAA
jgi:hypothetical protein